MSTHAEIGHNRTGIATSPEQTKEMMEGTREFLPDVGSDEGAIALLRKDYAQEAEPLGSVPPPIGIGEAVSTLVQGLRGTRPTQFIDKLGERLAFERSGVRLYEALLSKFDAFGSFEGGPSRLELEQIMQEEHEHFLLLTEAVTSVGGDPTVVTPSADFHATMSRGVLDVMVDPRTTFAQCLEAALLAELADNDAWEILVDLAEQRGDDALVKRFEAAREEEGEHLENVRAWVAAAQNRPESA